MTPFARAGSAILVALLMGVVSFTVTRPNETDCVEKSCEPGMRATLLEGACTCVRIQPCLTSCPTERQPW